MSNTSTFAVGLGGGLALWYLSKNKPTTSPSNDTTNAKEPTKPATPVRNCAVGIGAEGIVVDGVRVGLDEAVRRCEAAGRAAVTVTRNASASTYNDLMTALDASNVECVRNARRTPVKRKRRRNVEAYSNFTLAIYPQGATGPRKIIRHYHADPPTTWEDARDRLVAAGIVEAGATGPGMPGYWRLVNDPAAFRGELAKPLPKRRARDAARATTRFTREGRTILHDGAQILYIDRVDLGNERYAISPHEADQFAAKIVRLLNGAKS